MLPGLRAVEWQGGGTDVLYKIIAQEAALGRYTIVLPSALPAGVDYLRDPMEMNPQELEILAGHLRVSTTNEMQPANRFQFNEPHPGKVLGGYQEHREGVELTYQPEAWAHMQYLENFTSKGVSYREDGPPLYSEGSPIYLSFQVHEIESWAGTLGEGDSCIALLYALEAHNEARPHEGSVSLRSRTLR